jgi:hypothetical protein
LKQPTRVVAGRGQADSHTIRGQQDSRKRYFRAGRPPCTHRLALELVQADNVGQRAP